MQPRLMRSRNEKILGGVCGGLGEYFAIDPVIVRLVFVLVTLTSGLGILVYPILWVIMPKAPLGTPSLWGQQPPQIGTSEQELFQAQQAQYVRQEARWGGQSAARSGPAGAPNYRYDPVTGERVQEQQVPPQQPYPTPRRSWRVIGITVLAIGLMAAGNIFGFTADLLFPILLIAIGALLLRRR